MMHQELHNIIASRVPEFNERTRSVIIEYLKKNKLICRDAFAWYVLHPVFLTRRYLLRAYNDIKPGGEQWVQ